METAALPARPVLPRWSGWAVALLAFLLLWKFGAGLVPWAFDYPRGWTVPAARWITGFTKWLLNEATFGLFTFAEFTRFIAAVIDFPYRIALSLLSTGFLKGEGSAAVQITPPLSWVAVIVVFALIGLRAGGWRLAALAAACLGFIAVFGQWQSAMVTLASILVAVPLGVLGGGALGILAWRSPAFERAIRPVLDLMQTIPVFAYLVPILFLFGFGPTAAVVATLIYAMPPMTRITHLALARVPGELTDLGRMVGCSRRQMLWRVMVPASMPALMVGVNQVIMLSLNMVIIASMIGAGGLGFDVLAALRRLDFGAGLEAGLAIVALAVALDRLSQAFAVSKAGAIPTGNIVERHPYLASALATILIAGLVGLVLPAVQSYPKAAELSTGRFWSDVVAWINVNFFDAIEAVKNAILLNLLVPFKRFLLGLPWLGVAGLLGYAGWRLGGWRLAALVAVLAGLIAATGQWEKAMITVYLCGISVMFAMLIGVPIGILAAERERLWTVVRAVIDTLQTLPSFVYLMPAVMLFRVGDFTAMIAVVAYSVAPAIRYTVLGLQGVDPRLLEAGRAMGCTPRQILWRIKLKLAAPEILLGLNQTVMFALSMLVITALVGTRDLGQEVYIALTKADPGRGLVAGLAVAFIAIITDRLIHAGARAARTRLGLGEGAA
ncbi:ABC transporter permease subunit [Defluviimonas sp. WL0024]|uniref:ABC transporter permease subunit n=2 Tax=Albidovulum TaxID=205889 RepID=A0ABT3J0T8_9RHOB|nr:MULTISPECIES: ABC transporter permease subunit [Defluviimonas]MCU9847007.1 ABC transporter permease subunit [Defluviimonas sp. WL0024]MCW3781266.1 ABC transporter permease subunit [Defluviimonas salinarum]